MAIEIDERLATRLPATIAEHAPDARRPARGRRGRRAARRPSVPGPPPTALVANLPYNVSVPVLLHLLTLLPSLERGLVMVQAEVADRLAAGPGSKVYGIPSVKAAWFADVRRAGAVGRNVFWPAPNVDSGLVAWTRRDPPATTATREQVFAVVDAAFAQRRKTLRGALRGLAGSAEAAEAALARRRHRPDGARRVADGRRTSRGSPRRWTSRVTLSIQPDAQRSVTVRAPAKINLHLGVGAPARGRLPPARHRLPGGRALRRRRGPTDGDGDRDGRAGVDLPASVLDDLAEPGRQHRRPRRPPARRAPRSPTSCRSSTCSIDKGDPGRRRHGRRLRRRAPRPWSPWTGSGTCGTSDDDLLAAGRRARQRRAVRAGRRHRARHRPRRAGARRPRPGHLVVGGGPVARGPVDAGRSTAASTSCSPTRPATPASSAGALAALAAGDPDRLAARAAQRPRGRRPRPAPGPRRPDRPRRGRGRPARHGVRLRADGASSSASRGDHARDLAGRLQGDDLPVVLVANGPVAGRARRPVSPALMANLAQPRAGLQGVRRPPPARRTSPSASARASGSASSAATATARPRCSR